ncbi:phage portal protein [Facklamia sp. P9177]|uniref:phage portal protein n=1 Tax=Facklamia sp. P9177 TaxID=3421945 RepID=UPI003D178A41
MGIFDIFGRSGSHSNPQVRTSLSRKQLETLIQTTSNNIHFQKYAIQLCVNKLASALSLCKFETYQEYEKIEEHYWWKFNFEPNKNMNMHDFLYQLVHEMVYDERGALVIQNSEGDFVVAESYEVIEGSFVGNIYKNIHLYGGLELKELYKESDVLRFQLPNKKAKAIVDHLYREYGRFLSVASEAYIRDRSLKLILNIGSMFNQQPIETENEDGEIEEIDPVDELMKNRFKNLFKGGDTLTPLEEGLSIEKLFEGKGNEKQQSEIHNLFDSIINYTADAFGIPRGLLKGDVADVEAMTDNFVTFTIRPLAKEIETELNRKIYKEEGLTNGSKIKLVTGTIQTYNVVSFAAAADKLIAASIATPNEMREALEWERMEQDKMDEIKVTKNYEQLETSEDKE